MIPFRKTLAPKTGSKGATWATRGADSSPNSSVVTAAVLAAFLSLADVFGTRISAGGSVFVTTRLYYSIIEEDNDRAPPRPGPARLDGPEDRA